MVGVILGLLPGLLSYHALLVRSSEVDVKTFFALTMGLASVAFLNGLMPEGQVLLDLRRVFADLYSPDANMLWLYIMVFSTLLPTAAHFLLFVGGLWLCYPGAWLRRWFSGDPSRWLPAGDVGVLLEKAVAAARAGTPDFEPLCAVYAAACLLPARQALSEHEPRQDHRRHGVQGRQDRGDCQRAGIGGVEEERVRTGVEGSQSHEKTSGCLVRPING